MSTPNRTKKIKCVNVKSTVDERNNNLNSNIYHMNQNILTTTEIVNLIESNLILELKNIDYKSEIYSLEMVENIVLENFTISQKILNHHIQESVGIYKNMFPSYMVDMIRFEYVASSSVNDLRILNAGSNPLVFENVYGCLGENLYINGAWNKGKKGNGYVRFSRAFYSELKKSTIKNIRHLTVQWSSANNLFSDLYMKVDINLHGGYSHDNMIRDIKFELPSFHRWKSITLTPPDARWAPQDGKGNIAQNIVE